MKHKTILAAIAILSATAVGGAYAAKSADNDALAIANAKVSLTHAESLESMCERAQQLTEQLLSPAKTQAGTGDDSQIDVSSMARELIAECVPVAEARQIDLGREEATPLSLYGSPHALHLIIRNALDNALKETQPRGEVTLRLCASSDHAVIEVIDNGPGIPDAERACSTRSGRPCGHS
ncbi:MAG: HAMP domain-containing sensor histidine kinase [Azoarcus sp.]|jgi:two-component system OmpR family sensor kinase|nr:HAMP domain-containing histidine kinase [Azoarcus sp.]MDX9837237.1 HAMP domain-containing sensor histidine kinase [Azoarcus sp.]